MPPQENAATIATRPSADGIAKTLEHGADPLDFIRKNLERLAAKGIDPAHAVAEVSPQDSLPPNQGQQSAVPAQPDQSSATSGQAPEVTSESQDASSAEKPEPSSTDTGVGAEVPLTSLTENIKHIRKSLNETKAKLQEKEQELRKVVEERDKYRTGEVLPDKVKELETKVQTLSKYQALVELETSPEFQEQYIKPLSEIGNKLAEIGKDYEIPEEVMHEALGISNKRELNQFLSEHFDAVGALDVKNLVTQAQTLQAKAVEAKKAPQEALKKLIAEGEQARDERIKQQRSHISVKAKDSWFKSLGRIREENKIPELIVTGNNTEHDEKIAKPIISAAATEYGKLVAKLADSGLTNLTDELSDAIANMVLLAHASAVSIEQRNEAIRRYNEVEQNSRRDTSYTRPPLGGSFGTGTPVVAPKITPPVEEAARNLLENVLAGYQNRGLAQNRK